MPCQVFSLTKTCSRPRPADEVRQCRQSVSNDTSTTIRWFLQHDTFHTLWQLSVFLKCFYAHISKYAQPQTTHMHTLCPGLPSQSHLAQVLQSISHSGSMLWQAPSKTSHFDKLETFSRDYISC